MGRYTLSINGDDVKNYINVKLSDIDKFTLQFKSVKGVVEALGYEFHSVKSIKINYKAMSKLKSVQLVLAHLDILKHVDTEETNQTIKKPNQDFIKYIDSFLKRIDNDESFFMYIRTYYLRKQENFIADALLQHRQEYLEHGSTTYRYDTIRNYLSDYKRFRELTVLIDDYELSLLPKEEKNQVVDDRYALHYEEPIEDDRQVIGDAREKYDLPYFSDEEVKAYLEELDNLPGSEPDYETEGFKRR